MEIRMLDKSKDQNKASFLISGIDAAMANSLRRIMAEEVPTMAMEDIEFRKNNSILYDEIIAHRLGLVPLKTDLKSYNVPEECKCEGKGCARCQLKLTLSVKKMGYVYAESIKSKDPKVIPVYPKMIIAKLLKGQDLEFEATAVLGTGKVHAKWSPGLIWYSYKPIITVNNKSDKLEDFRHRYPPQIFDKDGKIDKNRIVSPTLADACAGICDDIIKVEYDKSSFLFYVESWGQLTPKQIVMTAIDILEKSIDNFDKQLD